MLSKVELVNFGPLGSLKWPSLGPINLVIGGNGTGKTFLLKALYSSMRTLEDYQRGDDQRTAAEILAENLYWTFQPDKIGDLVTKGAERPLHYSMTFDDRNFIYNFGKDTTKQISSLENHVPPRSSNSIFLPAKEVLSIHHIILKSREQDKAFGFDNTYLDLARALRNSTTKGNNYREFSKSRQDLESMLGGKIEFDDASNKWAFKKGNQKFPIGVTAEGIKKIAILDTLLGNRYLDTSSVIFIDEPESALHPKAISQLLDIIALLSERGIQFFMASHSYFVIKKLFLIAQEKGISVPVISEENGEWTCNNLQEGMPDNKIIEESIRLYQEEVELVLT
ncbi:AAA family ATPase [Actinomycetaceae bacterium WB03_NA08]|uniref:AAA family ATPase n=3 Tax=Bacillati TaxID=1783272 RepID=A0A6N7VUL8_9ACTO|nr:MULTISPECIES: ATP-binding protein [Terrabacteria group]MSS85464.1 AAA family ATPase [Scrofimicrobium canadense]MST80634.1 AAA family ATPase [Lactobacillus equicursoris]